MPDLPFVTIVSGLPRSGTSMLMQMLAAGGLPVMTDELRRPDEDNSAGYYELEAVKRTKQDSGWLDAAVGRAVKVIYLLLRDLPATRQYRVLFMRRRLSEVVASQQVMLVRRGERGAGLPADELSAIFQRQLNEIEDWLAGQPNFDVLYVDHRDVIEDPMQQSKRVAEFLTDELDILAMANVVDSTRYRQRSDGS